MLENDEITEIEYSLCLVKKKLARQRKNWDRKGENMRIPNQLSLLKTSMKMTETTSILSLHSKSYWVLHRTLGGSQQLVET